MDIETVVDYKQNADCLYKENMSPHLKKYKF